MRELDITHLYKTIIGCDKTFRQLSTQNFSKSSYPPYNIIQYDENNYEIVIAVAGFSDNDIEMVQHDSMLLVSGRTSRDKKELTYLYQGLATRNFEKKFQLAEYVKVDSANLKNGLLHISLFREIPESAKPRKIKISSK
ncbi:heat-shock protein IbpA [Paraphotobacterium marinum]|uniref:Heat-shock protein IbpA n=1 Tax=Paraphotobacterium marinum TaxID=1755811 RepID=A0A220VH10_9GAMM|nr:Hsp20 family protein [Paraphotobacterium marinum]ASK79655.1 heat-shock protein IbpA [Paraphotobacterium marinum]